MDLVLRLGMSIGFIGGALLALPERRRRAHEVYEKATNAINTPTDETPSPVVYEPLLMNDPVVHNAVSGAGLGLLGALTISTLWMVGQCTLRRFRS